MANIVDFSELKGKFIEKIIKRDDEVTGDEIFFITDREIFKMHHIQECCEQVYIEDVCGDFEDLIEQKVLVAEEVTSDASVPDYGTWTFYKIVTNRGAVTIRWYGTSNGYYSESADLELLNLSDLSYLEASVARKIVETICPQIFEESVD